MSTKYNSTRDAFWLGVFLWSSWRLLKGLVLLLYGLVCWIFYICNPREKYWEEMTPAERKKWAKDNE